MLSITFIDIITIVVSFILGILFASYLEKNIWPSFNKKYGLGDFEKNEKEEENEENEENK